MTKTQELKRKVLGFIDQMGVVRRLRCLNQIKGFLTRALKLFPFPKLISGKSVIVVWDIMYSAELVINASSPLSSGRTPSIYDFYLIPVGLFARLLDCKSIYEAFELAF